MSIFFQTTLSSALFESDAAIRKTSTRLAQSNRVLDAAFQFLHIREGAGFATGEQSGAGLMVPKSGAEEGVENIKDCPCIVRFGPMSMNKEKKPVDIVSCVATPSQPT